MDVTDTAPVVVNVSEVILLDTDTEGIASVYIYNNAVVITIGIECDATTQRTLGNPSDGVAFVVADGQVGD